MAILSILVTREACSMGKREIAMLEAQLITTKREALRNCLSLTRTAISPIYGSPLPDDRIAKTRAARIPAAMTYGTNGFFFVCDDEGKNIASPRQTWLIEKNWAGLKDTEGTPVVDAIMATARQRSGDHAPPAATIRTSTI